MELSPLTLEAVMTGGAECNTFAIDLPRDEEFCRDRLVTYLRPRLSPLNVWVEPEVHMAADQADIAVYGTNQIKLPIELKRDTPPEL